jgi:ABC-2 type transport system permease protein
LSRAYAIAVKDIKEVFSSLSIYGPMLGVPLFFAILLPVLTFYVAIYAAPTIAARITQLHAIPSGLTGLGSIAFMTYFSVSILGPIFMTMPILTATVIAADSFAGEKERKTSEALLSTPVTKSELLYGKILASLIPTIILTICVFALYGGVTDILAINAFHASILPTLPWIMMIATSPFLAIAAIGVVVLISSHVKGIKESQQISTLLILPVLVMPFISILGIAALTFNFFVYLIIVLAIVDAVIIYIGIKTFHRESIL